MASLDRLYRSVLAVVRFFSKGWGPVHAYESLARFNPTLVSRSECAAALQDHSHAVALTKVATGSWGETYTGSFKSPTATLLPDMLPPAAEIARFELLLPSGWESRQHRPVYIHLAGTGDHGFYRRRHLTALPLLKKEGIGALILENPFYGSRKPLTQTRSQLLHVSDLFALGLSLMLECLVLQEWLEKEGLGGPVGITGLSMGGHNASLSAAVSPKPVPVVPCLSWSTASSVFTQGMLSGAVCWDVLEDQLAHSRSTSDTARNYIFDFALEQAAMNNSPPPPPPHPKEGSLLMASSGGVDGQERRDHYYSWVDTKRGREKSQLHWETMSTLRAVLDLSTHLSNYPVPLDTGLAHYVVAKDDLYVPRQHIANMKEVWPGCEVTCVTGGHVSAAVLQQQAFQTALVKKMKDKTRTLPMSQPPQPENHFVDSQSSS